MFDWNAPLMLAQDEAAAAGVAAGIGVMYFACIGFSCLLSIGTFAFQIWMIVDCVKNEPSEGNDKIVWILVIVLASLVGALVYYFVRRPQRIARFGR